MYSIPGNLALDVQYKDDEGDLITLNTDSELDDVLAMHTIFTPLAPVKFDVIARGQSMFPSMGSFSTRASSVVDDDDDIRSQTAPSQMSNSIYGSYHSDDVSLIDLEEEREHESETQPPEEEAIALTASVAETLEQSISYPQQYLEDATRLQKEVDRLEALKLDAPIFTSSLLGARVEDARDNQDTVSEKAYSIHDTKQSVSSSLSALTAEFNEMIAENTFDSLESTTSQPEQEVQEEQEVIVEERKDETELTSVASESESFPTTSTASTSTSEHRSLNEDSALIEQFQLLIKEFQEIIQNNPQLVALAGNVMNKVITGNTTRMVQHSTWAPISLLSAGILTSAFMFRRF